jgi:SP family myo-inositol transporter-like MFS transporter 13
MMKGLTPSGAFGFYAAICGLGWVLIFLFYPEVSGLTLEEIGEVFEHGFGVRYASQLRKERKDIIKARLANQEKPVPMDH